MNRVFVIEDHPIVREGIKKFLRSSEFVVVGEAGDGEDGLELLRQTECDFVLVDIRLPKKDGLELTTEIRRTMPHLKIVVLTGVEEDHYASILTKAGAAGYVTKDSSPLELVRALRAVASGRSYISVTPTQHTA
jgi:DNA-binding NarL/FixJ family response regulator